MDTDASLTDQNTPMTTLPTPSRSSLWRWSNTRSAALCGGALMGALAFGGVAGAATHTGNPPAAHGIRPGGKGVRPTAGGNITALSGDDITISTRNSSAETIVYSSTTTFKTMSGTTTAADLKVGEFISVQGKKTPSGDVTANTIMIGTGPPGNHGGRPGQGGPPKGGMGPAE
jgi:Domain of unknown function (DUF5666)